MLRRPCTQYMFDSPTESSMNHTCASPGRETDKSRGGTILIKEERLTVTDHRKGGGVQRSGISITTHKRDGVEIATYRAVCIGAARAAALARVLTHITHTKAPGSVYEPSHAVSVKSRIAGTVKTALAGSRTPDKAWDLGLRVLSSCFLGFNRWIPEMRCRTP